MFSSPPPAIFSTVEVSLGSTPAISGSFDITSSGLSTSQKVVIALAAGPYTGKGTLSDETEMDSISVAGLVVNSTTIRCYWNSGAGFVSGNFKFNYSLN